MKSISLTLEFSNRVSDTDARGLAKAIAAQLRGQFTALQRVLGPNAAVPDAVSVGKIDHHERFVP